MNAIGDRLGVFAPALSLIAHVEDLKLLDRLGLPIDFRELVGEHQPDFVLVGTEIRELFQRAKRLVDVPGFLHPVRILEEVDLRVVLESLLRADLPELVVDRRAAGGRAQNLITERDGVVEETGVGVPVDGLLVIVEGVGDVALAEH